MSEAEIIPETQESTENDAVEASMEENLLNTTIGDDYPVNDSQDFSLVDFGATQSTQMDADVNKPTQIASSEAKVSEIVDKPAPDVEAVQDAKVLEPAPTQSDEKSTIESENEPDTEPTDPTKDEDDEIIAPTPPDELIPPKRQLLGSDTALKRKANDSEELTAKMLRPDPDSLDVAAEKHPEDKQTQDLSVPTTSEADKMDVSGKKTDENVVKQTEELDTTLIDSAMDTDGVPTDSEAPGPAAVTEVAAEAEKTVETKSESEKVHSKSRQSIEVIYDKSLAPAKPQVLVEIDEEGEKIVLDASSDESAPARQEAELERKLTNGSDELKKTPTSDKTASLSPNSPSSGSSEVKAPSPQKHVPVLNLVSDSEGESSISEEKKSKIVTIEREMTILVKVKCLVSVDEVTRDIVNGEFTVVHCESPNNSPRERKDSDTSAMADISDSSKDPASPASVASNPPHTFPLGARLSLMSQASSSSNSSADSIKAKGSEFSLPRGVPKHAKKNLEHAEDSAERLRKDFKNVGLVTSNVLKFIHDELHTGDLQNGIDNTLEPFVASTPEAGPVATPKSRKRGSRVTKRTRSANSRTSKTNGMGKTSVAAMANVAEEKLKVLSPSNSEAASTPTRQGSRASVKSTPTHDAYEPLAGRKCFARWTDQNYYPGVIVGRTRAKLKVNFLDGKSKLLNDEFVVVSPETLRPGLSVYASIEGEEFGSPGVILAVKEVDKKTLYTIETDEDEQINVPIADIFLTVDQVKILREDMKDTTTLPATPTSSMISLDNLVDGSRRKQTPIISTPKSTSSRRTPMKKAFVADDVASSSGLMKKIIDQPSDTSDSNVSAAEDTELGGVQAEVPGDSGEFVPKGPQSRIKGKARSKKKVDDPETIATVGPLPDEGSQLFQGLNFILTYGSLQLLDKYKAESKPDSNSEVGTEYEEEWTSRPFIHERLIAQIVAGGGKVYENFDEISADEYENTKLITNVPNVTERSLLCLSVGIKTYNHNWIVRCCKEKRLLNMGEEVLPAGWSLDKRSYVEFHHRKSNKPFNHVVVVIPKIPSAEKSISLWQKIIENAGGTVQIVSDPVKDQFPHATVVLTNTKCPSWVEKQARNWTIPLVSTTWIVQCLIEGDTVPHDTQSAYVHTYTMN